jgi:ribonuclease E
MSEERAEQRAAEQPLAGSGPEGDSRPVGDAPAGQETGIPAVRRRRRRGGARHRGRARGTAPGGVSAEAGTEAPEPAPATGAADATGANGSPAEADGAGATDPRSAAARRRRRRGGRGRNRSRSGNGGLAAVVGSVGPQAENGESEDAEPEYVEDTGDSGGTGVPTMAGEPEPGESPVRTPQRRTRRRGGRGRSKTKPATDATQLQPQPGSSATEPAAPKEAQDEAEEAPTRTARSRRRPLARRRREPTPLPPRVADKTMLITQIGERDQIAVLEGRTLVEHYITRSGARSMVGNVYLGKVQNVLPGMEAAFVDLGRGRNAVLYAGEVSYDEEIEGQSPRIEHVLKAGQNVMVQVTKDPMGGKGARLTQEISLPGRYLVLVPNSDVFGISRRLPEKERGRLKDILKRIRPAEHGLIVRTAAEGATSEDLAADLERLIAEWQEIAKSAKHGRAPRVMYEEPELTVRVVRDAFTGGEFKEMVTDSPELHDKVLAYLKSVAPELTSKVRMHEEKLPLLEAYHVEEQIHKALERKVWLPSGGYIIIDRTEALTVIDVNTGKHVGKANLEETVTKTNLEAAEEIARQLRLRDIGGMIIIDFIDMLFERNRQKVIDTLKNAMALDKTRSQVFDISPLGLLEVTRKRVSAGLLESFSETCPTCEGRGIILTHKP